jgi:hypothetical protein
VIDPMIYCNKGKYTNYYTNDGVSDGIDRFKVNYCEILIYLWGIISVDFVTQTINKFKNRMKNIVFTFHLIAKFLYI